VKSRYLDPIALIHDTFHYKGEGFAITTLQCSLVEFIETTVTGEKYVYDNPNKKRFEYNNSKQKFIGCLTERLPFKTKFDHVLAKDFYENVRCGLLHEAQTKNNWLIRIDNKTGIIEERDGHKIFDRFKFGQLLNLFLEKHRTEFVKDKELQSALRRKLNVICDLDILS
jgi:hypothetical protein